MSTPAPTLLSVEQHNGRREVRRILATSIAAGAAVDAALIGVIALARAACRHNVKRRSGRY